MKLKLIDNWKEGWKFYSTWAIAALMALPDLYNMLAAAGVFNAMPESAQWAVRGGAALALISRFVNQNKPKT